MEHVVKTIDSIKLALTSTRPNNGKVIPGREYFGCLTVEDTETPYPREIYVLKNIALSIGKEMFNDRGTYGERVDDVSVTVEHTTNANDLFFDAPNNSLIKSSLMCKCKFHTKGLLVTTGIIAEHASLYSNRALMVDIRTIEDNNKDTILNGMVVKQGSRVMLEKKFTEIDSLKDIDFTFNPHVHRYEGEVDIVYAVMDMLLKIEEEYGYNKMECVRWSN